MMSVLFPDWRYVVTWVIAASLLLLLLLATDGADALLLGTTAAAGFWARDCLHRLRRWQAGVLVPGYSLTTFVVATGIVGGVAGLATAVSSLAGNTAPAFGMATMVGFILVLGLSYAKQLSTVRRALTTVGYIAVAALLVWVNFGGPLAGDEIKHPLIQWSALGVAVAAIVGLKHHLDQPAGPTLQDPAMPWRYFRPFVTGPKDVFGGFMARNRIAEGLLVTVPLVVTIQAYDALDSVPSLLTVLLFYAIYVGSLTPTMLLKGAGTWLSTAWRLGLADSRPRIGQIYVSRIVVATLATLALVLVAVGGHALLVPPETLRHGHRELIDEALLLYAIGLGALPWASYIYPRRTTRLNTQVVTTVAVCVGYVIVFQAAPTFQTTGRAVLLLLLLTCAAVAVHVGGRAIARIDFLPTTDD